MVASETTSQATGMRPTLGLTGVTVNAMALIAPGAFLWITLQIQAAQTVPGGGVTALDRQTLANILAGSDGSDL